MGLIELVENLNQLWKKLICLTGVAEKLLKLTGDNDQCNAIEIPVKIG